MITLADIERRRDRLAALIDPIVARSEQRGEHSAWPDELKAIIAAASPRLPVGWGDIDEQFGRILAAAKSFEKRGSDQRRCVAGLSESLARLEHAIQIRRDFPAF